MITLVVQGLTLAPVIRLLDIVGDDEEEVEERFARNVSIRAGAEAIARLAKSAKSDNETGAKMLTRVITEELERLEAFPSPSPAHLPLRLAMIAAERVESYVGGLVCRGRLGRYRPARRTGCQRGTVGPRDAWRAQSFNAGRRDWKSRH